MELNKNIKLLFLTNPVEISTTLVFLFNQRQKF